MARMKCPDCQTVAKLDVIPASGKVFCSGCGRQFRVKDSPPTAPSGPMPVARAIPTNPPQARAVPIAKAQVPPQQDDDEVIDLSAKPVASKPLPVAKAIIVEPDPPQRVSSSSSNIRPPQRSYDDDDRPRKLKKKKKSGSNVGIWVAAGSGAVLVIAGLCVMLWIALGSDKKDGPRVELPSQKVIEEAKKAAKAAPRQEEQESEPVTPPWRGEGGSGDKAGSGSASNDAPSHSNPATDNAESSLQPANFGGAGDGGGADVYPYVLKSSVFILSLMKDNQHIAAGSGSLIDKKNRLVLTNHHVAGDARESVVFFPNYDKNGKLIAEKDRFTQQFRNRREMEKKIIYAKVLAADQHIDLCLLQLSSLPPGVEALPVAKNSCRVGQRVHSVGNPGTSGALWVYAPGVVRQVYHRKWKVRDDMDGSIRDFDADIIETQSPTNHGDSGGPLVNDRGELVGVTQGVVVSQGTQLSLFIDLAEVRRFVDSSVQDRLHMAWSPDARGPMNISTGGAGMMTGNLTDLVKALSSADSKQKTKAAEALGEMGEKAKDAIPSLLKLLSDPDDFTKRTAQSALVKIGLPNKTDVPLFANSLREPSVELRRYAASTLERMGADARGAAADLTAALGDNDPMVRQSVARALGKLGREVKDNAVRPLELLLTDANRDNRMAAAEGLADLYAASNDMESLKKMLKNQDIDVRGFAVKAFAKMGKAAKPVLPDLLEMAKSDTGDVRRATVQLLALVDPIDSKPGLNLVVESLSSGDKETKLAALAALGVLAKEAPATTVNNVKEMVKDNDMKKAAIAALSKLGTVQKAAVMALAELLKESDDESRDVITKAIVDLGPAAGPAVNEIIKLMDVSGMVVTPDDHARVDKYAAILAKIGKPAIPALRRGLARNANIRHWGCAKALGEMGPIARDAVRDLQILLAQEVNGFIRTDIEDAIRKILNQ